METFTREFKMRLSQAKDSMMSMMHSQITRAVSAAIAEMVFPEIQNIVSSMSSSGNQDTEASLSPNSQEITEKNNGFKSKITKKDLHSACDLRKNRDRSPYFVTWANDTNWKIPEFLIERIHSNSNLYRQELIHNVSLDTTLPAPEPEVLDTSQDPLNRLADWRTGQPPEKTAVNHNSISYDHSNDVRQREQKSRTLWGLVPYSDKNATRNGRPNETQSLPLIATKRSIADI